MRRTSWSIRSWMTDQRDCPESSRLAMIGFHVVRSSMARSSRIPRVINSASAPVGVDTLGILIIRALTSQVYFEAPEPRAFIRAFIADVRHLSYALEPGIP